MDWGVPECTLDVQVSRKNFSLLLTRVRSSITTEVRHRSCQGNRKLSTFDLGK